MPFSGLRERLLSQQEQLKTAINNIRSFEARLDGCKGALARAQSRMQEATKNVLIAQQQQAAASSDVIKLETGLKELEQAVLEQNPVDQKKDCLHHLQSQMKNVVEQMVVSGNVERSELDLTMQQMEFLFGGLQTIKDRVLSRRAAAAPAQPSVLQLLHQNASLTASALGISTPDSLADIPVDASMVAPMEAAMGERVPEREPMSVPDTTEQHLR